MNQLSQESQQHAREVLAHYLKERGSLTGEGARKEGEEAARNIRAAFEALEEVSRSDSVSGNTPPDPCEAQQGFRPPACRYEP